MWNLKQGRNAFIGRNRGMPDRNFWWYLLRRQNHSTILDDPRYLPAVEWQPNRSNCPELEDEVSKLTKVANPEWRALLSNVFVGRTLDGELNAEAKQKEGSAWVAISLQYTSAVAAYVTAYDRMNEVVTQHQVSPVDPEAIAEVFHHIAISRSSWADEQSYAGVHRFVLIGPHERDGSFYAQQTTDSEMFVICHEFGHHLLGHTSSRAPRLGVEREVDSLLNRAGRRDFVHQRRGEQTQELKADIVGLHLAGLPRNRSETQAAYAAMIGAICALLAEADVKDNWFLDEDETHPSTTDRITLLLSLMPVMFANLTPLSDHDSVVGLRNQLAMFATACLQSSLHSRYPNSYPAPAWDQIGQSGEQGCLTLRVFQLSQGLVRGRGWISI